MAAKTTQERIDEQVAKIADAQDTDIFLLNADFSRGWDNKFIIEANKRKRRTNLLLVLVTPGGDADVAYRIARYAQQHYEKFVVFISGFCKSAGTLCVLGAHEIVMSDQGELGPLDIQFYKKDELEELSSGLVIGEALTRLQGLAFSMFEDYFLDIKRKSGGQVSLKMATDTAANLVIGLFNPIYNQIDPMVIGDIGRGMTIAKDYGTRLLAAGQNFDEDKLKLLIESYPSHGFVIDRREAEGIFRHVRASSDDEERLARLLAPKSRVPQFQPTFEFLNSQPKDDKPQEVNNGPGPIQQGGAEAAGSGSDAGDTGAAEKPQQTGSQ